MEDKDKVTVFITTIIIVSFIMFLITNVLTNLSWSNYHEKEIKDLNLHWEKTAITMGVGTYDEIDGYPVFMWKTK